VARRTLQLTVSVHCTAPIRCSHPPPAPLCVCECVCARARARVCVCVVL
jgi:hypothetical protein